MEEKMFVPSVPATVPHHCSCGGSGALLCCAECVFRIFSKRARQKSLELTVA